MDPVIIFLTFHGLIIFWLLFFLQFRYLPLEKCVVLHLNECMNCHLSSRMLRIGWYWPSGFSEVKNVTSLQMDRPSTTGVLISLIRIFFYKLSVQKKTEAKESYKQKTRSRFFIQYVGFQNFFTHEICNASEELQRI